MGFLDYVKEIIAHPSTAPGYIDVIKGTKHTRKINGQVQFIPNNNPSTRGKQMKTHK